MLSLRRKFTQQRYSAHKRRIRFELTFEEWIGVWRKSGRLAKRGCKRGKYLMSRPGDVGSYALGNVKIVRVGDNMRDGNNSAAGRSKAHKGKPHNYPKHRLGVTPGARAKMSRSAKRWSRSIEGRAQRSRAGTIGNEIRWSLARSLDA